MVGKTFKSGCDVRITTARTYFIGLGLAVLIISISYAMFLLNNPQGNVVLAKTVKVACIGDSITEWTGYPTYLQNILGDNFSVGNFGVSGTGISSNSEKPYYEQAALQKAKDFQPAIIVIMLGTNDAHTYSSSSTFASDYMRLISEYQSLEDEPGILIVEPPPIYENDLELSGPNLQDNVIPIIEQVAEEMGLPTVDVNSALMNHPEYFEDGVHPNAEGALAIATEISESPLFQDYIEWLNISSSP